MRTIALLLLFAAPVYAQQRLTYDQVRDAVPSASAEFVEREYDIVRPTSAEQVKIDWLIKQASQPQKPPESTDWTKIITAIVTILSGLFGIQAYNRYYPPAAPAQPVGNPRLITQADLQKLLGGQNPPPPAGPQGSYVRRNSPTPAGPAAVTTMGPPSPTGDAAVTVTGAGQP